MALCTPATLWALLVAATFHSNTCNDSFDLNVTLPETIALAPGESKCSVIGCGNHDNTCWCNDLCKSFGSCCPDFDSTCGTPAPAPATPTPTHPTPAPPTPSGPTPTPTLSHCEKRRLTGKKVLMHYMLWFNPLETNGHWTWYDSKVFNPYTDGCNNTQHIATWYPPVTGAFASYDVQRIKLDIQQMKDHCVDGLIFDYQQPTYTVSPFDRSLPLVIDEVVRQGLEFAIMYDTSSKLNYGQDDPTVVDGWNKVIRLARQYADRSYLKDSDGNLVFLAFAITPLPAPRTGWPAFDSCPDCVFYTQDGREDTGVYDTGGRAGSYAWIEPDLNQTGYLRGFYRGCKYWQNNSYTGPSPCMGIVYTGFEPVYDQARITRTRETFEDTLQQCLDSNFDFCQVATWNDFNEGTHVAPSYTCNGDGPMALLEVLRDAEPTPTPAPTPGPTPAPPPGPPPRPAWEAPAGAAGAALLVAAACLCFCGRTCCRRRRNVDGQQNLLSMAER